MTLSKEIAKHPGQTPEKVAELYTKRKFKSRYGGYAKRKGREVIKAPCIRLSFEDYKMFDDFYGNLPDYIIIDTKCKHCQRDTQGTCDLCGDGLCDFCGCGCNTSEMTND